MSIQSGMNKIRLDQEETSNGVKRKL